MFVRNSCISVVLIFFVSLGTPKSANCDRLPYKDASSVFTPKKLRTTRSPNCLPPCITVDTAVLARTAREVVNSADWAPVASISSCGVTVSYPFISVKAVSDGARGSGTGIPYFFLSPLELLTKDLDKNNKATFLFTMGRNFVCLDKPIDGPCTHVHLIGTVETINGTTDAEYEKAEAAIRSRHGSDLHHHMNEDHFALAKLNIESIIATTSLSGTVEIPLNEYHQVPPTS